MVVAAVTVEIESQLEKIHENGIRFKRGKMRAENK
jgi:hypothetical protein